MRKYNTPINTTMNKVWAFTRTLYSLDMCCIFPHRTKNGQRLYFLTRSSYKCHNWHILHFKLHLECDMGWYRCTSHSENHCAECEIHDISQLILTFEESYHSSQICLHSTLFRRKNIQIFDKKRIKVSTACFRFPCDYFIYSLCWMPYYATEDDVSVIL